MLKTKFALLLISLTLGVSAHAQLGGLGGLGSVLDKDKNEQKQLGGTYKPDGFGGLRGSDNNSGSGYRSDGFGGLKGSGNNAGAGYRADGFGGLRGTGDNAGGGWRADGFGGLRGTGSNAGKKCREVLGKLKCT